MKFKQSKSKSFHEMIQNLKTQSIIIISKRKSNFYDEFLRVSLALICLYYECLPQVNDDDSLFKQNQGLNQFVFLHYYNNISLILKAIKNTIIHLGRNQIKPEYVLLSRKLIRKLKFEQFKNNSIDKSLVNILYFLHDFIIFYEDRYGFGDKQPFQLIKQNKPRSFSLIHHQIKQQDQKKKFSLQITNQTDTVALQDYLKNNQSENLPNFKIKNQDQQSIYNNSDQNDNFFNNKQQKEYKSRKSELNATGFQLNNDNFIQNISKQKQVQQIDSNFTSFKINDEYNTNQNQESVQKSQQNHIQQLSIENQNIPFSSFKNVQDIQDQDQKKYTQQENFQPIHPTFANLDYFDAEQSQQNKQDFQNIFSPTTNQNKIKIQKNQHDFFLNNTQKIQIEDENAKDEIQEPISNDVDIKDESQYSELSNDSYQEEKQDNYNSQEEIKQVSTNNKIQNHLQSNNNIQADNQQSNNNIQADNQQPNQDLLQYISVKVQNLNNFEQVDQKQLRFQSKPENYNNLLNQNYHKKSVIEKIQQIDNQEIFQQEKQQHINLKDNYNDQNSYQQIEQNNSIKQQQIIKDDSQRQQDLQKQNFQEQYSISYNSQNQQQDNIQESNDENKFNNIIHKDPENIYNKYTNKNQLVDQSQATLQQQQIQNLTEQPLDLQNQNLIIENDQYYSLPQNKNQYSIKKFDQKYFSNKGLIKNQNKVSNFDIQKKEDNRNLLQSETDKQILKEINLEQTNKIKFQNSYQHFRDQLDKDTSSDKSLQDDLKSLEKIQENQNSTENFKQENSNNKKNNQIQVITQNENQDNVYNNDNYQTQSNLQDIKLQQINIQTYINNNQKNINQFENCSLSDNQIKNKQYRIDDDQYVFKSQENNNINQEIDIQNTDQFQVNFLTQSLSKNNNINQEIQKIQNNSDNIIIQDTNNDKKKLIQQNTKINQNVDLLNIEIDQVEKLDKDEFTENNLLEYLEKNSLQSITQYQNEIDNKGDQNKQDKNNKINEELNFVSIDKNKFGQQNQEYIEDLDFLNLQTNQNKINQKNNFIYSTKIQNQNKQQDEFDLNLLENTQNEKIYDAFNEIQSQQNNQSQISFKKIDNNLNHIQFQQQQEKDSNQIQSQQEFQNIQKKVEIQKVIQQSRAQTKPAISTKSISDSIKNFFQKIDKKQDTVQQQCNINNIKNEQLQNLQENFNSFQDKQKEDNVKQIIDNDQQIIDRQKQDNVKQIIDKKIIEDNKQIIDKKIIEDNKQIINRQKEDSDKQIIDKQIKENEKQKLDSSKEVCKKSKKQNNDEDKKQDIQLKLKIKSNKKLFNLKRQVSISKQQNNSNKINIIHDEKPRVFSIKKINEPKNIIKSQKSIQDNQQKKPSKSIIKQYIENPSSILKYHKYQAKFINKNQQEYYKIKRQISQMKKDLNDKKNKIKQQENASYYKYIKLKEEVISNQKQFIVQKQNQYLEETQNLYNKNKKIEIQERYQEQEYQKRIKEIKKNNQKRISFQKIKIAQLNNDDKLKKKYTEELNQTIGNKGSFLEQNIEILEQKLINKKEEYQNLKLIREALQEKEAIQQQIDYFQKIIDKKKNT